MALETFCGMSNCDTFAGRRGNAVSGSGCGWELEPDPFTFKITRSY